MAWDLYQRGNLPHLFFNLSNILIRNFNQTKITQTCLFYLPTFSLLRYLESLQRRTYITPTSYLELIKTFKNLLERKRLDLLTSKNRYLTGLEKLEFAESQISIMQHDLTALQPQLEESSLVFYCFFFLIFFFLRY